jgi:DNA repair protein RadC
MADMCPFLEESVMDYSQYSNLELVQRLLGENYATKLYRSMLAPFFLSEEVLEVNREALGAATELIERWADRGFHLPAPLSTPELVREFVRITFGGRKAEGFAVLILDADRQLAGIEEIWRGEVEETRTSARRIVRRIVGNDALSVIFVRYRPEGKAEPGAADQWLVKYMKEVLAILEVEFVDYIIAVGSEQVSLAERGLLS